MKYRLRGMRGFVAGIVLASVVGVGGFAVVRATSGSSSASSFVPVSPVRVLDTRSDLGLAAVTDGVAGTLKVTGSIPTATSSGVVNAVVVPAGATAVVLNVTAVNPTAGGYVSLRPGDATGAPTVSTLNVTAGGTFPNGATITIPTTGAYAGQIQVWYEAEYTTVGSTELLIDIAGYYELASSGPAGATGPAGPQGVAGPAGLAGADGVDATVAITQQSVCDGNDADTTADELCKIGMTGPGGGLVFFVDYQDEYENYDYLEAAPADAGLKNWSVLVQGCGSTSSANCNSSSIYPGGTTNDAALLAQRGSHRGLFRGSAATDYIVSKFVGGNKSDYAAGVADDYVSPVFNGNAKNDWWLPTIFELKQMQVLNLMGLGLFVPNSYYSSSSESSMSQYWAYNFDNFYADSGVTKTNAGRVRPVRGF